MAMEMRKSGKSDEKPNRIRIREPVIITKP